MGLLSTHEAKVWQEFQKGKPTGIISEESEEEWTPAYVSRVLNRARRKRSEALEGHALSHRLDVENLLDYKGLLIGFDYQANAQVYIVNTEALDIIVWYKHEFYGGEPCPRCPKESECMDTLQVVVNEYSLELRPDEMGLPMTERSIAIFNKQAAKESPRYQRNHLRLTVRYSGRLRRLTST
ncbi:MAG: hypothetical protein NWE89_00260 [Candidatus Bathyarchaeota archaeon]|nr:hypothetical protein [Candidatus Bathyarchaeota archaeon]